MSYYSLKEISTALGKSHEAVRKRSKQWQGGRPRQGHGGGTEYPLASLPVEWHQTLLQFRQLTPKDTPIGVSLPSIPKSTPIGVFSQPEPDDLEHWEETPKNTPIGVFSQPEPKPQKTRPAPTVDEGKANQRIDAWLSIFKAQEAWCAANGHDKIVECDIAFAAAYNAHQIQLEQWIYEAIPDTSRSTLARKRSQYKKASITALGGNYGTTKGKGLIESSPELQAEIEAWIVHEGKQISPSRIHRMLGEFCELPEAQEVSEPMLRRWIKDFKAENPQKWAIYMDANKARGTVAPAFGSRSKNYIPNSVWELDSSPTDIALLDEATGVTKRHAVVGCIDVATRRARLLVSPTSKSEAILLLLRACIQEWGVPEGVKTDNGRDYISRRVERFLAILRIEAEELRCLPGHPEEKPHIERFFRTFQHRDLPALPGFVGHNLTDRQALRGNPDWNEKCIELAMPPEKFQVWCDKWCRKYEQRPHGRAGIGLEGMSPLEKLAEYTAQGWIKRTLNDPRKLDFLMLQGQDCTVNREGIRLQNRYYVAPELGGRVGERVHVCFEATAPEHLYIYKSDELDEFICRAVWRDAPQINQIELAAKAKAIYKQVDGQVSATRKRARQIKAQIAKNPERLIGDVAAVTAMTRAEPYQNPALDVAVEAFTPKPQAEQPLTAYEQAVLAEMEARESAQRDSRQSMVASRQQRIDRFLELFDRIKTLTPGIGTEDLEWFESGALEPDLDALLWQMFDEMDGKKAVRLVWKYRSEMFPQTG